MMDLVVVVIVVVVVPTQSDTILILLSLTVYNCFSQQYEPGEKVMLWVNKVGPCKFFEIAVCSLPFLAHLTSFLV